MGDDPPEDVDAYILNSKYRRHVLVQLADESAATPTEIAGAAGIRRPHVSRALTELRERDVVDLRVPEYRSTGRYYGLTDAGREAWVRVKPKIRSVDWRRTDPDDERVQRVVEIARDACGDDLRTVCVYDGERVDIVRNEGALAEYTDEEFEEVLRTFVFERSLTDVSFADDELWSEVEVFDRCTVVRVRVDDGRTVSVSCERERDIAVPALTDRIAAVFD